MRLLHARTKTLEEFFEKDVPLYAILSHTWGKDEVLFKDIMKGRYKNDSDKIEGCCREALRIGLDYIWIDTCCIDKRSSAELSEAINSMFNWYRKAGVCYAYLADVHDTMDVTVPESTLAFRNSRWWTRGWTLQELLAPNLVKFYSATWTHLGDKARVQDSQTFFGDNSSPADSINGLIAEIAGIGVEYLNDYDTHPRPSVAERMSWAAQRQTTRVEDVAYSLLGIFQVNMPLLYGEKEGAFRRLQEAIISSSDDQSIFVWESTHIPRLLYDGQVLASSPSDFAYGKVVPYTHDWVGISPYSITNVGLQLSMRLRKIPGSDNTFIGLLNCMRKIPGSNDAFMELWPSKPRNSEASQNIVMTLIASPKNAGRMSMAGPFIRCSRSMISVSSRLFQDPDNDPYIPICIRSESLLGCFSGLTIVTSIGTGGNYIKVVEVYPPSWQPIINGRFFWDCSQQIRANRVEESAQQIIHLHCLQGVGKRFVVRLKYGFRVVGDRSITPLKMEIAVAQFESGISLAEVMIVHKDHMDTALDWQQQLDLGDGVLTFRTEIEERQRDDNLLFWIVRPEINRTRASQVKHGDRRVPKAHSNIIEDIPTRSYVEEQKHLDRKRKRRESDSSHAGHAPGDLS